MAWADDANVGIGDEVACGQIPRKEQGTTECEAGFLLLRALVGNGSYGLLCDTDRINHRAEFIRFERKRAIRPRLIA